MENDEIKDLGREYLRKNPKENEKDVLAKLIYDDYPNKISNSKLNSLIKDKIKSDFETQNIVTLNGWILSITEARQCALFSLN
jgi:hypothetical protein